MKRNVLNLHPSHPGGGVLTHRIATPVVTVERSRRTPSIGLPHFWVGLLFALTPFLLFFVVPTNQPTQQINEVQFIYREGYGYVSTLGEDVSPPHPYAYYAAACVILGWAYWLYCIYRTHRALAKATDGAHPISPLAAAGFHLFPLVNLYWVFKWTNEMAKTVYDRSYEYMHGRLDGAFLLVALAIVYVALRPLAVYIGLEQPSAVLGRGTALDFAVLAHAVALGIAVLVGMSASRHVGVMLKSPSA